MAEAEAVRHLVTDRHRCAIVDSCRLRRQEKLADELARVWIQLEHGEARGLGPRLLAVSPRYGSELPGRDPVDVHLDLGNLDQYVPALGLADRFAREEQEHRNRESHGPGAK